MPLFFLGWAFLYSPLAVWYAVDLEDGLDADAAGVEVFAGGGVPGVPVLGEPLRLDCFCSGVIVPIYSSNQFFCCKCKGYGQE
ncbi:hypothetical protein [Pedobacter rhizosphaerae]|uniref:Uncharacterized protein n=1 Tax=Pedobacter rhizosphaerae TaxID=390241 RepID=A0A1H9N3A3_9SPHI|nr:hypothetical protein [Pedobacter rhizosphaerae]SER30179.1 hypothetical protein SAMN04488023_1078 [Pedobacter rhizosphaerae]